ncbi:MAG: hypothetical protein DRO96_01475 [Candidatus Aenigmatarchaeota archaeon]|nr:MAG: hypothetical protein DRO96_01475 [Candidatus Aenigmarchaeota archaeon]
MMKNKKRKIKLCASSPLSANDFVGSCAFCGCDVFFPRKAQEEIKVCEDCFIDNADSGYRKLEQATGQFEAS